MLALALSLLGGLGTYYLYTSVAFRWTSLLIVPAKSDKRTSKDPAARDWLKQAGLADTALPQLVGSMLSLFILGYLAGFVVFAGPLPGTIVGLFATTAPLAAVRRQGRVRKARAHEAWPRMLEEMRILTGSLGRSIPQALFEVGNNAPAELQSAFRSAHREWLISTDFSRTVAQLKAALADATADAALETLLVAHEIGGTDLDTRLATLAENRAADAHGRKDAVAKQAGARFARWFVLIVPLGMALAGMSIGNGRQAYGTFTGQLIVVMALAMIIGCWVWASTIMRLPDEQRVLRGKTS